MRFVIYGAGAVGGTIGARLHQHGHEVLLVARGAHRDALQRSGLRFETRLESVVLRIPTVGDPAEIAWRSDDVVLLTTKTQQTAAALGDLRDAAGSAVPVVCAQNGVENERLAARIFERVYAMLVYLPATHLEPGLVQATAAPICGILDAGVYPAGVDRTIERVTAALDASSFSARPTPDILSWKYGKLLANLGNAIQATCGAAPHAGDLYSRVRAEALACYAAAGIAPVAAEREAERRKAMSAMGPVGGQDRSGSSTWQSLARASGSVEVDYLNGEIALLGKLHGIPTPANSALQRLANRMARERAAPGSRSVADVEAEIRLPDPPGETRCDRAPKTT
jgi:2-dehydropantoate 2-reductase